MLLTKEIARAKRMIPAAAARRHAHPLSILFAKCVRGPNEVVLPMSASRIGARQALPGGWSPASAGF